MAKIYRRHLGIGATASLAEDALLDAALTRIREKVSRALDGPAGRLDGSYLRSHEIYLFRNHADLALDLAAAGRISHEGARAVLAAAAKDVRFLPANPFGFDDGARERLRERILGEIIR